MHNIIFMYQPNRLLARYAVLNFNEICIAVEVHAMGNIMCHTYMKFCPYTVMIFYSLAHTLAAGSSHSLLLIFLF